jgi:hypothetical protein
MNSNLGCNTESIKSFLELINSKVSQYARGNYELDGYLDPTGCSFNLIEDLKKQELYIDIDIGEIKIKTSDCVYFKNQITTYNGDTSASINMEEVGGFDHAIINPIIDIIIPSQKYVVLASVSKNNKLECYNILTDILNHQMFLYECNDDEAREEVNKAKKIVSESISGKKFEAGKTISVEEACTLLASKLSPEDCEDLNFKFEELILKLI